MEGIDIVDPSRHPHHGLVTCEDEAFQAIITFSCFNFTLSSSFLPSLPLPPTPNHLPISSMTSSFYLVSSRARPTCLNNNGTQDICCPWAKGLHLPRRGRYSEQNSISREIHCPLTLLSRRRSCFKVLSLIMEHLTL